MCKYRHGRGAESRVTAYMNDLAVLVNGKFPHTLCDILQGELKWIENCANEACWFD